MADDTDDGQFLSEKDKEEEEGDCRCGCLRAVYRGDLFAHGATDNGSLRGKCTK
ncbi:hypothetical protein Barb7_02660 [Bacteroidales bacterium Barb7]|nr:hypothetical protein Barb7_02660 [Bacteroidales bacterium Barb7]